MKKSAMFLIFWLLYSTIYSFYAYTNLKFKVWTLQWYLHKSQVSRKGSQKLVISVKSKPQKLVVLSFKRKLLNKYCSNKWVISFSHSSTTWASVQTSHNLKAATEALWMGLYITILGISCSVSSNDSLVTSKY